MLRVNDAWRTAHRRGPAVAPCTPSLPAPHAAQTSLLVLGAAVMVVYAIGKRRQQCMLKLLYAHAGLRDSC